MLLCLKVINFYDRNFTSQENAIIGRNFLNSFTDKKCPMKKENCYFNFRKQKSQPKRSSKIINCSILVGRCAFVIGPYTLDKVYYIV